MRLLLPPSEGKTQPESAADQFALENLSFRALDEQRLKTLSALAKLASGPNDAACKELGLGKTNSDLLPQQVNLATAAAAPSLDVYTGVLYQELFKYLGKQSYNKLTELQRTRMDERVLIFSGLWGVVTPSDPIPAYRLPAKATLPGLGKVGTTWKSHLKEAIPTDGLLIDMRSSDYRAMWTSAAAESVYVNALVEYPNGQRKTISHMAKASRGRVAGCLLKTAKNLTTAKQLSGFLAKNDFKVELAKTGKKGEFVLTVIEPPIALCNF